jgi:ankyrin repeat protein
LAKDRGYGDVVAVIEEEEQHRRAELSCPNSSVSPVQEQINAAIARGDRASAMRLLQEDGSLIQACDRGGGTPLHTAAEVGDEEMVAWLLERRANVRKEDMRGFTPLDRAALAVAEQFPSVARRLLASGAEMTIRAAVALGNGARVRELIQEKPGLLREVRRNGGPLTLAVRHGQLEMARLLLDLGVDVDERVMLEELEEPTLSWGMPLWQAALEGQRDMVELLLDRGADPNANVYASGWPLRNAWDHEDDSVKRLLLERGAKRQPYMVAEAHDVEEARRLLEADASEETARELVWSAADHGCPEIVALALPRIKLPLDGRGGHWMLMQPIRGADDGDNEGFFRSMEVLLRGGVDPNSARFGQTVLHYAAADRGGLSGTDRSRFAGMLIDAGARLDVRDDLLRSTPLGWACRWGRKELVELLLARGATVHEADAEAWAQPQAWAEKMGHEQVLAVLRKFSG